MKISALLPYKPDNGRRDFVWSYVKKRYEQLLPEIELCIGINQDKLFNYSKARNEAAKIATGEIFIVVDTDVIFEPSLIQLIKSNINLYPWIIPFTNGYRLSKEATDQIINQGPTTSINIEEKDVIGKIDCPGPLMNVMKRSCFEAVFGFDERFKGPCFQDLAFTLALDTICGEHGYLDGDIYHLWHQEKKEIPDEEQYWKNSLLYSRYEAALFDVENMKKLINEQFQ